MHNSEHRGLLERAGRVFDHCQCRPVPRRLRTLGHQSPANLPRRAAGDKVGDNVAGKCGNVTIEPRFFVGGS